MLTVEGLGARLNDEMFRRGWTRRGMAKRAGISHETVNQALNNRATRRTLEALEDGLGLEPGSLLEPGAPLAQTQTTHLVPANLLRAYEAQVRNVVQEFEAAAARAGLGPKFLLAVLDAYERTSREARIPLPPAYWSIRQRVYEQSIAGDPATAAARVRERLRHDE